jgi:hypothetical protein
MARELTEKQQKFLEVLFNEAEGDAATAKRLAGYSENVSACTVTRALEKEIEDLTRRYISRMGTKAAYAMGSFLSNPTQLGGKEKLTAAKDLLDRSGFVKTEKVEITAATPLFILPAKDSSHEDEDD